MRTLIVSFLPIIAAAAAPAALWAQNATSFTVQRAQRVTATWSGPTPACRLDRCGPNEIRVCLLRFCQPDSTRGAATPGTVWPFQLLDAARPDSGRRPVPAPRPRR